MTRTIWKTLKPELQYGQGDTLYYDFMVDGVLTTTGTTASTATVGIVYNDGETFLTATTATWTSSQLSYAFTSTQMSTYEENFRAQWTITYNSVIYVRNQLFDVVRNKFEILVNKTDLIGEEPELDNQEFSADTNYIEPIISAHSEIADLIRAKGSRPALILDNQKLFTPHLYLTLHKIYKSFAKGKDDIFWTKAEWYYLQYKEKIDQALNSMIYDLDEDVVADDNPVDMSINRVKRV